MNQKSLSAKNKNHKQILNYLKNKKIEIIKSPNDKLFIDVDPQIKVNFNNGNYVQFLEPLTDGPINPHEKLETLFNYYKLEYPVLEACKKSFKHLQLFLVNDNNS